MFGVGSWGMVLVLVLVDNYYDVIMWGYCVDLIY